MKKLKMASSKATQKLKRTFSKLTHHKGGGGDYHQASSPSTADRDHVRAEGLHYRAGTSMDAAALGSSAPQAEAPATSLEWAAAAGVMTREQWAGHLRELESSGGGVRARYHSGSSAARRGDDEEEEDAQREEERRRRREKREKREKEARRKRREEAAVDERKAPARRNSRHSHRSRRSSSSSEATTTSSSSGSSSSSNAEEREREERRRKRRREKEKRRRRKREREERELLRRKRESRRASLEARYLADNVQRTATADAATQREYEEANDDELLQVPVEEDEEAYHRGDTSSLGSTPASDGEGRRSGYSGAVAELEDVLDEAHVKSPARDRPSERDEGANDEEDGYEDYDYASSGPIGAGTTESDGSLVVSTTLDRLPPATAPNLKAGVKPILTSLGASPPPDASGESDDDDDQDDRGVLLATTTVTAKTAGTESGVGGAVTEQQEMALSPVKQGMTLDGEETIADGGAGGKRRMSGIFLSDTDSGARAESAPGGDAAHS